MEQTCWKHGMGTLLTGHHADDQVLNRIFSLVVFVPFRQQEAQLARRVPVNKVA